MLQGISLKKRVRERERKKERIDTGEPSNDEVRPKILFFQGAYISQGLPWWLRG